MNTQIANNSFSAYGVQIPNDRAKEIMRKLILSWVWIGSQIVLEDLPHGMSDSGKDSLYVTARNNYAVSESSAIAANYAVVCWQLGFYDSIPGIYNRANSIEGRHHTENSARTKAALEKVIAEILPA